MQHACVYNCREIDFSLSGHHVCRCFNKNTFKSHNQSVHYMLTNLVTLLIALLKKSIVLIRHLNYDFCVNIFSAYRKSLDQIVVNCKITHTHKFTHSFIKDFLHLNHPNIMLAFCLYMLKTYQYRRLCHSLFTSLMQNYTVFRLNTGTTF